MEIIKDWGHIRKHFNTSFRSNFHVTVASVNSANEPTATPIGSLFLNDNQRGFYFEKYPSKLPKHANQNKSICVLGVNSGTLYWLRSLYIGRFNTPPALKLYGELGIRRKATEQEIKRLKRRMRFTKLLKGNRYLWGDMEWVREVSFAQIEKVHLGKMTLGQ